MFKTFYRLTCYSFIYTYLMKAQNKIQINSSEFQQDTLLSGDLLNNNDNHASSAYKTADHSKKVLSASIQKKSNPRLFIL